MLVITVQDMFSDQSISSMLAWQGMQRIAQCFSCVIRYLVTKERMEVKNSFSQQPSIYLLDYGFRALHRMT